MTFPQPPSGSGQVVKLSPFQGEDRGFNPLLPDHKFLEVNTVGNDLSLGDVNEAISEYIRDLSIEVETNGTMEFGHHITEVTVSLKLDTGWSKQVISSSSFKIKTEPGF